MPPVTFISYREDWRATVSDADAAKNDSGIDLDEFLKECQLRLSTDTAIATPKKQYEYVVRGIFKDPCVKFDPLQVMPSEGKSDRSAVLLHDPLFESDRYRQFINTLSNLMETQRLEVYERVIYTRKSVAQSHTAVNFTSKAATDDNTTLELLIHKPPSPLAGKCTLVELDRDRVVASAEDMIIRTVGGTVGIDIVSVLPMVNFEVKNRMFVCGHVFGSHYGTAMQAEIAVLRHYLDCNPQTPLSPNCFLVEIRFMGEGDIESCKARLREYTQLLYNYAEFSFE
ncbi:uncharacterized protein BBOV_IV005300 [Babesia bovis T2Bo]|uniref:Mediator of RNA polymerase II transcription subunit 18 n=1 Tax=Babesia bovis TaxID=5865 RepID=A7AQS2_BABBO|nr:uncharacterized protein BBOV_IV005300 [Babesia bovis T2Bo]EDO06891.1 hypothetical protein BBOV_IV005300 [Babesia bovis T2Bo]BAN64171.1 hypothetical protein [Babesia bovis]|eukprot:XP_001610459.1 hypothetical protein [Babesia bovis T2Bo]